MSALGKDIQGGRQEKVLNREVLKGVGCSGNGDVNSVPWVLGLAGWINGREGKGTGCWRACGSF